MELIELILGILFVLVVIPFAMWDDMKAIHDKNRDKKENKEENKD